MPVENGLSCRDPAAKPLRFAMQELVGEIAESAGIEVRYNGPEDVRLDRTMITWVLLNLARSTEDGSEFKLQLPMEMFTSGR